MFTDRRAPDDPGNGVKTVASVGDKPLPIRSGTPDSSVRAQDPEPIVAVVEPWPDLGAGL